MFSPDINDTTYVDTLGEKVDQYVHTFGVILLPNFKTI